MQKSEIENLGKLSDRAGILKNQKKLCAFTLPEVVIAVSILAMTIVAATGVLVTVMRANSDNVSSLVAFGLAQEGIEAVRAMRDSNWFLGLSFEGKKGEGDNEGVWGEFLPENSGEVKYFSLERNSTVQDDCGKATGQTDFSNACLPFKLVSLGDNISEDSAQATNESIVYKDGYKFVQGSTSDSTTSGYRRFIKVEALDFCTGMPIDCVSNSADKLAVNSKYQVTSFVSWMGGNNQERSVILTTELTNWKR